MPRNISASRFYRWVKRILGRYDHRYSILTFLSLCGSVAGSAIIVGFPKLPNGFEMWPAIAVYFSLPFVFVWSFVRLVRSYEVSLETKPTVTKPSTETFFITESREFVDQLSAMKVVIDGQLKKAARSAARFEVYGQIATVFAIGMPLTTWIYAFLQANSKVKFEHLWTFIFSSTSFGFVAITVAVTLLRHSKAHTTEANRLRQYSDSLHRIRIALSTDAPAVAKETLEILAKYAKSGNGASSDENPPQSPEELKNALSIVTSMLSKT
jgi:hypothetical protein